jgi:hypothetical protein
MLRTAGQQLLVLPLQQRQSPDARSDVDADLFCIGGIDGQLRIRERLARRGHGVVCERVHLASIALVEVIQRIESSHLARDAARVVGGVELGDRPDPAASRHEGIPRGSRIESHGGDETDAGDDDSTVHPGL